MSEHRSERRMREVSDSFCIEPGCEYENSPAVQGHCFHVLDDEVDRYITRVNLHAEEALESERRIAKDDADYLSRLESMYVCAYANWTMGLDQRVRMRREMAALKKATQP